jgi:DNA-binding NtrC family response regulator
MLDILLAEDDEDTREAIATALEDVGHRVSRACDGDEAQSLSERHVYDVAICDVNMPRVTGIDLARRLRLRTPSTAVVVMTSQGRVADIVDVMRGGAIEFLIKPFEVADLEERILRPIDERRTLKREFEQALVDRLDRRLGLHVVASGPRMRALVDRLSIAAQDDSPVLLHGEAGTGKKTLARLVHERGPRKDGPFVVVPCATLSQVMIESELRALSRGADVRRRDAWFREAEGGTLVLDGVDGLPTSAQTNLIRVLTEPASLAVRDAERLPRGVRVIATAGEGALDRVLSGEWIEPLFFRLAGLVAHVPPLRERDGDRLPLAAELLARLTPGTKPPAIEPSAWEILSRYPFPGNVSELLWALQWALLMCDASPIEADDLPPRIHRAVVEAHLPANAGD